MEVWLSSFQYHWCTFSVSWVNTSFMNRVGGPFCKVPNIHQCIIGQYYSVYSSIICAQFTKIIITMIHVIVKERHETIMGYKPRERVALEWFIPIIVELLVL